MISSKKIKVYAILHLMLFIYSFGGIASKTASSQPFLSINFFVFYGIMLLILFMYAIFWQQILKHIPLTIAFANKAIIIIWGILWGNILFGETISLKMIIGAIIIIAGILLVVTDNE